MKDCDGCPIYDHCYPAKVEAEAYDGAVEDVLRGVATLYMEAETQGKASVENFIADSGGPLAAIYLKSDGSGDTEKWLSQHPDIANLYLLKVRYLRARKNVASSVLERVQETCHGPEEQKRFFWFGKVTSRCTSISSKPSDYTVMDLPTIN